MTKLRVFCLALLVAWQCSAAEPENGWWFARDKPFTGLDLELQNETLLVGYFTEVGAERVAYNAACAFTGNACSGEFLEGVIATGIQFSLAFPERATVGNATVGGEQFTIERFEFGWAEPPVDLLGVWIFTLVPGPIHTSETLVFSRIDDSGDEIVLEGVRDGTGQRAIALYDGANDIYVIAVDDSAESVILYNVVSTNGINILSGTAIIVDRAGNPQTDTLGAIATRLLQNPKSAGARAITRPARSDRVSVAAKLTGLLVASEERGGSDISALSMRALSRLSR